MKSFCIVFVVGFFMIGSIFGVLRVTDYLLGPLPIPKKLLNEANEDDVIFQMSKRHGVPAVVMYALRKVESGGNPKAKSKKGALGQMQIMPKTAKYLHKRYGLAAQYDPNNQTEHFNMAAAYLKELSVQFNSWFLGVAAYNAGPGNLAKAIKKAKGAKQFDKLAKYLPAETVDHQKKFTRILRQYVGIM